MRKKTTRRIRQSIVAGVVGVACVFGCGNLEIAFAETATVTDATAGDASAEETPVEDATKGDATDMDTSGEAFEKKDSPDVQTSVSAESKKNVTETNQPVQQSQPVSSKKYEGEYHIDYILSHYSYFVQNDLEGDYVADTVGAVMVGNKLNLKNTVGKVKAAASYAKYLIDLADYHAGSWNDTTGIDTNFYYTESRMSYKDWLTDRMVKVADDYINMNDAFAVIKEESKALEKAGQSGYVEQGDLIIDFADSKTITVNGSDFANAKRVILKNVTAEDIFSNAYTISVSGNSDYVLDTAKIEIGGTPLNNNYFFNMAKNRPEGMQGGQYYGGSFGLVWNFPDAKSITASFLTGHIIAPSGDVSLIGGNHEGQVIAQNIKSSSESHFYPYNVTTTESGTTTETVTTTESGTTTETVTTTESGTTTETVTTTESGTTTETMTTTESGTTTETMTTTEIVTTTENSITTTEQELTRHTLVVPPKASSTSTQVQTPVVAADNKEIKTGDTMALGIVITLLVASAGGLLLFAALHEHKKK